MGMTRQNAGKSAFWIFDRQFYTNNLLNYCHFLMPNNKFSKHLHNFFNLSSLVILVKTGMSDK